MSATSRDIFGRRSLERGHLSSSGQGRGCCQASKVRDGPHLAAQPQGMAERLPEAGFSHQPRFPGEKTNTVKGRDLFKDTQLIDRPPGCAGAPDKAASQSPQGKATVRCAWNVSLSAFVTPLLPLGQRPPPPREQAPSVQRLDVQIRSKRSGKASEAAVENTPPAECTPGGLGPSSRKALCLNLTFLDHQKSNICIFIYLSIYNPSSRNNKHSERAKLSLPARQAWPADADA